MYVCTYVLIHTFICVCMCVCVCIAAGGSSVDKRPSRVCAAARSGDSVHHLIAERLLLGKDPRGMVAVGSSASSSSSDEDGMYAVCVCVCVYVCVCVCLLYVCKKVWRLLALLRILAAGICTERTCTRAYTHCARAHTLHTCTHVHSHRHKRRPGHAAARPTV